MDGNVDNYAGITDNEMRMKLAVTCGDLAVVKEMIDKNICVDVALEESIWMNEVDILQMILECGLDVNTVGASGKPPLFLSVSPLVEIEIFNIVLRHGPDLNLKDNAGRNILHFIFDEDEFCDQSLELDKISRLLPLLSDEVCLSKNYRGQTFLHFINAIHNAQIEHLGQKGENRCERCTEFILELLKRNVSVNSTDMFGVYPIQKAAQCACEESLKLFLQAGASVKLQGGSPLMHSLCESLEEESFASCLKMLLENGCSVNETSSDGRTPLHIATTAELPNIEILKCLVAKGADVHAKDNAGNTCIHTCVIAVDLIDQNQAYQTETLARIETEARKCIEFLASEGIDVNEGNAYGFTALHYAMEMTKINLVECLLHLGGNVYVTAHTGETPLHRAVKSMSLLKSVFDHFAPEIPDLTVTDNYGSSALHWAFLNGGGDAIFRLKPELIGQLEDGMDCKGRTPKDLFCTLHFDHFLNSIGISSVCDSESSISSDHNYHTTLNSDKETMLEYQADDRRSSSEETGLQQVDETAPIAKEENECSSKYDVFGWCELLTRITTESPIDSLKEEIPLEQWKWHLKEHEEALRKYANIVIESTDSGLYFDFVDNKQVESSIDKIVRLAAQRIEDTDPLLKCEVKLMGSRSEGTKVGCPDEFDYVFQFTSFGDDFVPEESELLNGYARLRIKESADHACFRPYINENGFLDAQYLVYKFYKIFNTVLGDSKLLMVHNLYPCKRVDPHKFSIDDVQFRWTGASYKNMQISVDIVPCVRAGHWIPLCFESSRQLLKHFNISPEISLVMKTQSSDIIRDWTTYFRISIAAVEAAILKVIPSEVRKGYILVKALKDSSYFPVVKFDDSQPGNYSYVTTYMIKCTFLHALEERMSEIACQREEGYRKSAIVWAKIITKKMLKFIEDESLPGFFMKNNLLDKLQDGTNDISGLHIFHAQCTCLQTLIERGTSSEQEDYS